MRRSTAAVVVVTLAAGGTAGAVAPRTGLAEAAVAPRVSQLDCSGALTYESRPADLTDADGTLFFTAYDTSLDPTMWSTDGTRAGTFWLNDLSGEERRYTSYSTLEAVGSTMFFTADGFDRSGALSGTDLWRSDGTKEGTAVVKHYTGIGEMADVEGSLLFVARDRSGHVALRRTDGTKAGTSMVKDFGAHPAHGPDHLTTVGDRLYFSFDDGVHGRELWTSDGTEAGTVMVQDIAPGGPGSYPVHLTEVGDEIFFWADDGVHGLEPWASDGTETGTHLVRDIGTGDFGSSTYSQVAVGDTLYFSAVGDDDALVDLWRSDGTPEGTTVIKQMGSRPDYDEERFDLATAGGLVFFGPNDADHGREVWRTDGTAEGTVLVKDIGADPYGSDPQAFTAVGDEVYFVAAGRLWRSDGTGAGTVPVPGLPTMTAHRPYDLTASGDKIYFGFDDGVHGSEVWVSDGTAPGTHLVRDVNRRVDWDVSSKPRPNPRSTAALFAASFDSPGRLAVRPALAGGVRRSSRTIDGAAPIDTTLRLALTKRAKRKLLRTGQVTIGARFTFHSCTGVVSGYERAYTLKAR
ncbi:ELWxxDGT repeat protein [Nocardioides sp. MH1]|uniref:ELWxxDGT repeat protein n=1 Tax=Nocardioides sp. MH1 TaxID=3242490 RepID=UPI003521454A